MLCGSLRSRYKSLHMSDKWIWIFLISQTVCLHFLMPVCELGQLAENYSSSLAFQQCATQYGRKLNDLCFRSQIHKLFCNMIQERHMIPALKTTPTNVATNKNIFVVSDIFLSKGNAWIKCLTVGTHSEIKAPNCSFPCCWAGTIKSTYFSVCVCVCNVYICTCCVLLIGF